MISSYEKTVFWGGVVLALQGKDKLFLIFSAIETLSDHPPEISKASKTFLQ